MNIKINTNFVDVPLQIIYKNKEKKIKNQKLNTEFIEFDKYEDSEIKIQFYDEKYNKILFIIGYIISAILNSNGSEIFDILTIYLLKINETVDDLTINYLGMGKFEFNKNVEYTVSKKYKKMEGCILILLETLIIVLFAILMYFMLKNGLNAINILISSIFLSVDILLLVSIIKIINRIDFNKEELN